MRGWAPYLLSLTMPAGGLVYLLTAPHSWAAPVLAFGALALLVALDDVRPAASRPAGPREGWAFDLVLIAAGLIHFSALALLLVRSGVALVDSLPAALLVGVGSAHTGIVVAHELIHRRSLPYRLLGRALLWTALYDHFFVEHLRGHHVRVGLPGDPTTATFGETVWQYARRSVPGQLLSAWRIDRAAVAVGLFAQGSLLAVVALACGPFAVALFLLQAGLATVLNVGVNYFDHWGLGRLGKRIAAEDAWDCDAPLSHHLLVGLPRHADHHVHASRAYQHLGGTDASPKLPYGYLRMVMLVLLDGEKARRLMTAELERKRLGPFSPP
jgi:alkane 1-monooxygenase